MIEIVVSSIEDEVISSLEQLENSVEKEEEPPIFHDGNGGNIFLLGSNFSGTGEEEEEEENPSYFDIEEEDSE